MTGLQLLGFIPFTKRKNFKAEALYNYLSENPRSALSRSLQSLYTAISLTKNLSTPKVLLLTSSEKQEGKSAIAVSFAISRALAGQKVIVLDCDIWLPSIHSSFNIKLSPGVIDILAGNCSIDDSIQHDLHSGVDIIPAGTSSNNPSDLLLSGDIAPIMQHLSEKYDLVIIDSPPALETHDARILARHVDTAIFVARFSKTRRATILKAIQSFPEYEKRIAGLLLNMVGNTSVKKSYTYGES